MWYRDPYFDDVLGPRAGWLVNDPLSPHVGYLNKIRYPGDLY